MKNFYHILGVDRNATNAEIKAAFKQLAAQYHPDRNTSDDAEERFKEINLAYQTLSDFYTRLQYEKELDAQTVPDPTPEESPSTIAHHEQKEEPQPIEAEEEESQPIFPLKWKLALLATPVVVLVCIGILKLFFTSSQEIAEQTPEVETPTVQTTNQPVETQTPSPKALSIMDLKRMAVSNPDKCLMYIDSIKSTSAYVAEMEPLKKKALEQLPAKTAYFFETNKCERAWSSYQLLKQHQPNTLTPHLLKQLDFYQARCILEQENAQQALIFLQEMEQRYKHQYSIVAAQAQLMHYKLKKPRQALKLYRKSRLLYEHQAIDEKFLAFWKPDFKPLTPATLVADEAYVYMTMGEVQKAKATALEAITLDSTQALPYELIGNSFILEQNKWGACKYWNKALDNGSSHATDSLMKYCY